MVAEGLRMMSAIRFIYERRESVWMIISSRVISRVVASFPSFSTSFSIRRLSMIDSRRPRILC